MGTTTTTTDGVMTCNLKQRFQYVFILLCHYLVRCLTWTSIYLFIIKEQVSIWIVWCDVVSSYHEVFDFYSKYFKIDWKRRCVSVIVAVNCLQLFFFCIIISFLSFVVFKRGETRDFTLSVHFGKQVSSQDETGTFM